MPLQEVFNHGKSESSIHAAPGPQPGSLQGMAAKHGHPSRRRDWHLTLTDEEWEQLHAEFWSEAGGEEDTE